MHRENTPELKELCEQSRSCFLQFGSLAGGAGIRGPRGPSAEGIEGRGDRVRRVGVQVQVQVQVQKSAGAEGCGASDAPCLTNTVTEDTGLS